MRFIQIYMTVVCAAGVVASLISPPTPGTAIALFVALCWFTWLMPAD